MSFLIFSIGCSTDEGPPLCFYDYAITVANKTELKIVDSYLVHNNNPSCNTNLDDFEYSFMDIAPLSTIELKGTANYYCDDIDCGGYGAFEFDNILVPNIEIIYVEGGYYVTDRNQTSLEMPTIDVIIAYKLIDFEFEVVNQTDSTADMMYLKYDESCNTSSFMFFNVEPNSSKAMTLSTVNLDHFSEYFGTCQRGLRWNLEVFLYRNDGLFQPDMFREWVGHNEGIKYTVTLNNLNQPQLSGE